MRSDQNIRTRFRKFVYDVRTRFRILEGPGLDTYNHYYFDANSTFRAFKVKHLNVFEFFVYISLI